MGKRVAKWELGVVTARKVEEIECHTMIYKGQH
jgi:hypothetical protein